MKKAPSFLAMGLLALGLGMPASPAHASLFTTVTVPVLGVTGGGVTVSSAADAASGNLAAQPVYSAAGVGSVQTYSVFSQGNDSVSGMSHTVANADVSNPAVAGAAASGGSNISATIANESFPILTCLTHTEHDLLVPTAGKVDVSTGANAAAGNLPPIASTTPAGVYSSWGVGDVNTNASISEVVSNGSVNGVAGISTTTATTSVSNPVVAGGASGGDSYLTGTIKDVVVPIVW